MVEQNLSLTSAIRGWWRERRQQTNLLPTLTQFLTLFWEFARESLPNRRRQRYGDAEYDWEKRVDTTSATVNWHTRLLGLFNSPYQPIPPEQFREMMATLSIEFGQFTFIDIGSGKGRALLLASEYGFRRIIGIELLPELDRIAQENIRRLQERAVMAIAKIELICGDATEFPFPAEPCVIFLFNPLREDALLRVLARIEAPLRDTPRQLYVLYANPTSPETFGRSQLLNKICETRQYSVYRA